MRTVVFNVGMTGGAQQLSRAPPQPYGAADRKPQYPRGRGTWKPWLGRDEGEFRVFVYMIVGELEML